MARVDRQGEDQSSEVKHVLGDLSCVAKGAAVIVRFGSQCYQAKITDVLEWKPPKKHRVRIPACVNNLHRAAQRRSKVQRAAKSS